jgi:REP element-mobilizing transposase RayT
LGSDRVRLEVLLKTIADQNGCELLAVGVHDGDYVHMFVSALIKVYVPDLMRVFKFISAIGAFN